jgi:hypothetical protein
MASGLGLGRASNGAAARPGSARDRAGAGRCRGDRVEPGGPGGDGGAAPWEASLCDGVTPPHGCLGHVASPLEHPNVRFEF